MQEQLKNGQDIFFGLDQYETIISAIPGGIVVTLANDEFTILFANQSYYEMVEYEKEEHFNIFKNIGTQTLYPDGAQNAIKVAKEQLERNGMFSVKAKLCHKKKGYIWVHFNGKLVVSVEGVKQIYIVIVDISEYLITLEQLTKEKNFNDLITSITEEVYFDCDLYSGRMHYSENFESILGMDTISYDYVAAFEQLGLLSSEQVDHLKSGIWDMFADGTEKELHFTLKNGEEVWYICHCTVLNSEKGVPVRILGKFLDITRHKMQIDELSQLAQQDQLTGLYNKVTTESHIKELLKICHKQDEIAALLIIDIDNFKNINDRLGHLYGDVVLTQLAEGLKALFRTDDIVGRVGGDEFFVFIKNYCTTQILIQKGKEICALFHKTYSEKDAFVTISASVGIAIFPEHGVEFEELYQKADAALYEAKAMGKNTFSFYHENILQTYHSTRTEIDANALKKSFRQNRIEYVFRLLYDSEDPVTSIQSVLQLVTESYTFSRGYIFEIASDRKSTSNTFEWSTKGVTPEIENLQNIPMEAINSAHNAFLQTGMFIVKSIQVLPEIERKVLEPQGIRSMFQFGIMDMGKLLGFIGFDDCEKERTPTDSEIDEICTVCHVLATFLLKHRSNERELKNHEALGLVMDHMNRYIYVIDAQDHTILYENQKVEKLIGGSSIGKTCHLAYRKSKDPCEACEAATLDENSDKNIMKIESELLGVQLHTEVMFIDWSNNRKAILFCGVSFS